MQTSSFHHEQSATAWQQTLKELPAAHPLQNWVWGDFKARWGWSAQRLTLTDGHHEKKIIAAAQVLERQVPRLSNSILYVPKGPLFEAGDNSSPERILRELEQFAKREKAIFIKIDPEIVQYWGLEREMESAVGSHFVQKLRERGWRYSAEQIQFRNTVELDLTKSEEELLAAMKSKTRYNIRLAGRKGITVRKGTAQDFPAIATMYQETAQRDGFTIRPLEYYLDAWNSFYESGMALPLLAEFEGDPLAAVIIVHDNKRAIYMYGASTDQERQRMPNYLLQWEAIRWARSIGCITYDFWGAPNEFVESDPLWGVWRFKDGFQGEVVWHVGAWDYPARPFWYWIYAQVLPRYLDFLRSRNQS
jgi:peptidoglycan pentaglycine glycine transferase (the first glycine)